MKKVYVSATYNDLKDHREAVTRALQRMGYDVRCMENYVATDERVDARCKADVAECDFYIGIVAQRYGWMPKGGDQSITEMEYWQARGQPGRTRCLVFLLDEDAPWSQRWIDALHDPASAAKLNKFREQFAGTSAGVFRSVEELVREVMAAIHVEDAKTWKLALQKEFDICLEKSRVQPMGTPSSLANGSGYSIDPGNSAALTIVQVLQIAIANANVASLIELDLGNAGGWWSTRLLLLVTLLIDYM
jgi:hypothetical protein